MAGCSARGSTNPKPMFPVELGIDLNLVYKELLECKARYRQCVWQIICDKALSLVGAQTGQSSFNVQEKSTTPPPIQSESSLLPSNVPSRTQPQSRGKVAPKSRQNRNASRRQSESPATYSQRQWVRNSERQSQRKLEAPMAMVVPLDDETSPRRSTNNMSRKSEAPLAMQEDEPTPSRKSTKKSIVKESRASSKKSIAAHSWESRKKKAGEEDDDEDDDEDYDDEEEESDDNADNRASRLRQLICNNRSSRRRRRSQRRKSSLVSSSAESTSEESGMSTPDGSSFEASYSTDLCDRSYRSYRRLSKRKMMTPTATLATANNAIAELAGLMRRSLGSDARERRALGSDARERRALGRAYIGHRHKSNPDIESEKSQPTPFSDPTDTETCDDGTDGTSCKRETCKRHQKQLHELQLEKCNQQLRNGDVSHCHRCNKPRR